MSKALIGVEQHYHLMQKYMAKANKEHNIATSKDTVKVSFLYVLTGWLHSSKNSFRFFFFINHYRSVFRTYSNIYDEALCKKGKFFLFSKKALS